MKLIVSVMPRSLEEAQALDATRYLDADIIEWRADYLPKEAILQVAPAIFEKFAGRELVFTLRTRSEGGEIDLSPEEYIHLIKEVAQLYQPDYIDFEYYSYKDVFEEMLDFPNLVLSYHNFQETPENMMEILSELTILNPKLVKVAVMAHTEQDVLDLMNYTRGFKTLNPEQEYVTISMGKVGKVSRITADVTGSSWSFASLDEVSAPGQISLASMKKSGRFWMKFDGYTRLAAVVANPIKHSISPFIHNRAFEATATNGAYVAWEIEASDLAETVANIRRYQMFGINLSMPYKEQVIPYLDELSDEARLIGAVNTVVNENGNLIGYNTDGKGFFKCLPSFTISGKKMTLLGAGGAAKSILAQAILDGVSQISVFVRSVSMEKTRPYLDKLQEQTGFKVDLCALEYVSELQARIAESDLLVNATSVGMDGQSSPVPENIVLPETLLVADIIYQPFETPFLKWARSQGNPAVNGLGMLLYQAAEAFQLWTGKEMPTEEIWQSLTEKYQ